MLDPLRKFAIVVAPGRSRRKAVCVAVLAISGLAASPLTTLEASELTGAWFLDEARSDDPAAIVERADHGGTVGRVMRSTSGTISVFGIPVPVPRPDEQSKPRSHDSESLIKSGHVLSVIDQLTISQDAHATELVYDNLKTATYEHGGTLDTGYSTVVSSWNGRRLDVEHALLGGAEITETYELTDDGERLLWNVRVKSKGVKTIRLSRVYGREGAEQALRFASSARSQSEP